jgi:hypothetical protein
MLFLGLVPHIPGAKTGSNFCKVKVQGAVYSLLVEDIAKAQRKPLVINHGGKTYKFVPVFCFNIADNEEADTWALVYQLYTMGARCRLCAVGADNMADLRDLGVLFKTKAGGKRKSVGSVKTLLLPASEKLKKEAIAAAAEALETQYALENSGRKRRKKIIKSVMQTAGKSMQDLGMYPFPHPMAQEGYFTFVDPRKLHVGFHSPVDRSREYLLMALLYGRIWYVYTKLLELVVSKEPLGMALRMVVCGMYITKIVIRKRFVTNEYHKSLLTVARAEILLYIHTIYSYKRQDIYT